MASSADVAIAIGTIAAAVFAATGLLVSLKINHDDRQRADQQARDDRRASADLAAADRAAAREDAQRRHLVDLLLQLGREVSTQQGVEGTDAARVAAQNITLLLWALPPECASVVRKKFNVLPQMRMPGSVGLKLGHLQLNAVGANASAREMLLEIAFDVDRYLNSGLPPDAVWDDFDGLPGWMRERWPRT